MQCILTSYFLVNTVFKYLILYYTIYMNTLLNYVYFLGRYLSEVTLLKTFR